MGIWDVIWNNIGFQVSHSLLNQYEIHVKELNMNVVYLRLGDNSGCGACMSDI